MNAQTVLAIAKAFTFVREVPFASNAGRWVEAIQHVGGTTKGNPWCACFVSFALGAAFNDKPPLPYTASCDELLNAGKRWGWVSENPEAGDVFLVLKSPTDAVHTGFVTQVQGPHFNTIEGNASDAGKAATREGWGVFERTRALTPGKYAFIRYERRASDS